MEKIYLAGGISDSARKKYHRELAPKIRELEYKVYSASENDSINDKSKHEVTPEMIYDGDIPEVLDSDIFVVCITGGNEDGTLSEIGAVAGWNEGILEYNKMVSSLNQRQPIEIVAYTTNERLMNPDFSDGISSAGFNHLIKGMIDKWGIFVGGEKEMLEYLERRK